MRAIPAALQAKLEAGATTLCACWRIDRSDGVTLAFTDHDADVAFGGDLFRAAIGVSMRATESATGLNVDNLSAEGALRIDGVDAGDLARGAFDGAELRRWVVDWSEPDLRYLAFRGALGEVTRGARRYEAEVRGLAERLNRPLGRSHLPICDAELGDGRCRVAVETPAFRGFGTVSAAQDARRFTAAGLGAYAPAWFDRGRLEWTSGANAGAVSAVRRHLATGLELALEPFGEIAAGDAFTVYAGCDKRFETCRAKFANALNFRGFPHIPGDDWVASYPNRGESHDGGSLFR